MLTSKNVPVAERESFEGLNRVFPSEEPKHAEMYDMVAQLRHLFGKLSNGKPLLSISEFERRMWQMKIIKKSIQRIDLTICF